MHYTTTTFVTSYLVISGRRSTVSKERKKLTQKRLSINLCDILCQSGSLGKNGHLSAFSFCAIPCWVELSWLRELTRLVVQVWSPWQKWFLWLQWYLASVHIWLILGITFCCMAWNLGMRAFWIFFGGWEVVRNISATSARTLSEKKIFTQNFQPCLVSNPRQVGERRGIPPTSSKVLVFAQTAILQRAQPLSIEMTKSARAFQLKQMISNKVSWVVNAL